MSCRSNQLTSLDVSNNTALITLNCYSNQLTSLDVSNNTALTYLNCYSNQLTSLDVSNNSALIELRCYNNQLTSLDVRNGNNTNFTDYNSTNNPDLTCIFVDDAAYSNTNWTNIDPASTFVNNEAECALSIGDNAFELDVTIYPNPTDNYLFIEGNKNPISISIYYYLRTNYSSNMGSTRMGTDPNSPVTSFGESYGITEGASLSTMVYLHLGLGSDNLDYTVTVNGNPYNNGDTIDGVDGPITISPAWDGIPGSSNRIFGIYSYVLNPINKVYNIDVTVVPLPTSTPVPTSTPNATPHNTHPIQHPQVQLHHRVQHRLRSPHRQVHLISR